MYSVAVEDWLGVLLSDGVQVAVAAVEAVFESMVVHTTSNLTPGVTDRQERRSVVKLTIRLGCGRGCAGLDGREGRSAWLFEQAS